MQSEDWKHIHANSRTDSPGCIYLYLCTHKYVTNISKEKEALNLSAEERGRDAEEASWETVEEGKGDGEVMQFCFD